MSFVMEGDINSFEALAFGMPHPGTLNFIQQSFQQPSRVLAGAAEMFENASRAMFETLSGENAMRRIRALTRTVANAWELDTVRHLETIGQFQQAKPTMQRWLMANPYLRDLYQQQKVEGYHGSYVDYQPGVSGRDHEDYQRVMSGVVQEFVDDKGRDSWRAETFFYELDDDEHDLTVSDRSDILASWDAMKRHLLARDDDPTSPYNASMG